MNIPEADLCTFCQDLVELPPDNLNLPVVRPHFATYGPLLASSETCPICQAIVAQWQEFSGFSNEESRFSNAESSESIARYPFEIVVRAARQMSSGVTWKFVEGDLTSINTTFGYSSRITLVSCKSQDPASNPLIWSSRITSFDEKVSVIKMWLNECSLKHEDCRPIPYLPRRLLAIGQNGQLPRLVERSCIPNDHVVYAALSYCWGTLVPLRTTKDNLTCFMAEIPWAMIPKTFTDAMLMAQTLDIQYIWIDALCIVQDDKVEWQNEAANMQKIYQGSYLTISATQSTDSTVGCFASQVSNGLKDETLFRTKPGSLNAQDYIVRISHEDIRSVALRGNVLNKRGWTLQEQMLSPRVISCLQPEIHWYCKSSYRIQSGLMFEPREMFSYDWRLQIPIIYPNHLRQDHLWHNMWRILAEHYSYRNLKYIEDKMPAIAGLTRYFAFEMDDIPILGLWKKTFGADLAWLRLSIRPENIETQGLPSWTWLSCSGQITYNFWDWGEPLDASLQSEWVEHVHLLDSEIQWTGIPLTSTLKVASVKVDGPALLIPIAMFDLGNTYNPPYLQVFGENLQSASKTEIPWRCAGQFDADLHSVGAEYWCLLLCSRTKKLEMDEVFLILEPVGSQNALTYKRIGLARIWGKSPTFDLSRRACIYLV